MYLYLNWTQFFLQFSGLFRNPVTLPIDHLPCFNIGVNSSEIIITSLQTPNKLGGLICFPYFMTAKKLGILDAVMGE